MLAGRHIVNGEEQFHFHRNPIPPHERGERNEEEEAEEELHLFLDIKNTPLDARTVSPDVSGKEEEENMKCTFCKKPWDDCDCITITPACRICGLKPPACKCDKCAVCGEIKVAGNCLCCSFCKNTPVSAAAQAGTTEMTGIRTAETTEGTAPEVEAGEDMALEEALEREPATGLLRGIRPSHPRQPSPQPPQKRWTA